MNRRSSISKRGAGRSGVPRREEIVAGIVVVDIGACWTRIAVSGDVSVRLVERTPAAISRAMCTSRDDEALMPLLLAWMQRCSTLVPELTCSFSASVSSCIVLVNHECSPTWWRCLDMWASCHFRAVTSMNTALASLASFGLLNGVILDLGWSCARAACVIGGVVDYDTIVTSRLGGQELIVRLRSELIRDNAALSDQRIDSQLLTDELLMGFMARYGNVPESSDAPITSYPLPLKTSLLFGKPEGVIESLWFTPCDDEHWSLPKMVIASADALNQSNAPLVHSLHVVGGGASIPNVVARLQKQLVAVSKVGHLETIHEKLSYETSCCAAVMGAICTLAGSESRHGAV